MIRHETKQRILAIGTPMMVRRLSAKIDGEQFAVTGCQDSEQAVALLQREEFDMVIVDNLVHNADSVCLHASTRGEAPVTLLLQEKPVDWRGLGALTVDGFLQDSGTNAEFIARLRAYIRRRPASCLTN